MRVFLAICAFGMTSAGCPHYNPEAVKLLTKTSMSYDDCLAMHAKDLCDKFRGMFREGPLPSGSRKLLGAPGFPPLPEPDSPITNNAFLAPPLLADLYQGYSLIDFVSAYSSGVYTMAKTPPELLGTDMCIWSFQALPPPPGADSQYHVNSPDAQKVAELCVLANERFQANVGKDKNDGAVVFGGCTIGKRGAKDICNLQDVRAEATKYNETLVDYYCNDKVQASSVVWPQAVTMFRVKPLDPDPTKDSNQGLKDFLKQWRGTPELHSKHIEWVYTGGSGSADGSVAAGWGAGGGPGITRKVVPCHAIDEKYRYPTTNFPFSIDALNPEGTATVMSDAFQHWVELCGMPSGFNDMNCEIAGKYPPLAAAKPPPAPVKAPPGSDVGAGLPSCKDYEADSLRCNQKVTAFGFDNQRQALQDERDAALKACAQTMCNTLGGGNVYEQAAGTWDCEPTKKPSDCDTGTKYMMAKATKDSCQMSSFQRVSKKILDFVQSSSKSTTDVAATAAKGCEKVITCETDVVSFLQTPDVQVAGCLAFFTEIVKDPQYAFAAKCDQQTICTKSAGVNAPTNAPTTAASASANSNGKISASAAAGVIIQLPLLILPALFALGVRL